MGTPGDKNKISQVVSSISETPIEESDELIPATFSEENIILQLPEPSTSSMTVLSQLPQLDTIHHFSLSPLLPQTPIKQEHTEESAALSNLEQAHIEDYFHQSKFYSNISEDLVPFHPTLETHTTSEQKPTILTIGEPGPSGLQSRAVKSEYGSAKIPSKKVKKGQSLSKRTFVCEICEKVFPNTVKLSKHQLIHSSSSPFKCEQCKKTFSTKFKLVRHVLIHSDRKQFSCTVCDRTFHRKDHLKNHVKVHSPCKTYYVCKKPDCKKEYTSHLSYKKHIALHAAEDGSLVCQICSKTFENKEQILYHLKIHAGSRTVKNPNEKKFTCDLCDRKFFTRKDVRRHMVVHTGMRDFLCQFCPQRFGRKDHLVRHIKKSHSKNLPSTQSSDTSVKQEIEYESSIQKQSDKTLSSDSEPFSSSSYLDPFFSQNFEELPILQSQTAESLDFLHHTKEELKDLGSEVLKDISEELVQFHPTLKTQSATDQKPSILSLGEPGPSGLQSHVIKSEYTCSEPSSSSGGYITSETITSPATHVSQDLLEENIVINDPDLISLLEPSENLPLPPFIQTFQPPPSSQ